jgi:hypothetical protein
MRTEERVLVTRCSLTNPSNFPVARSHMQLSLVGLRFDASDLETNAARGSVPQGVKGFDWYVEKVTVPAAHSHGSMQGVVWAIPKRCSSC